MKLFRRGGFVGPTRGHRWPWKFSGITVIVGHQTPVRTMRFRRRASDPWFDDDCRAAKRSVRLFERRARQATPIDATAVAVAWRDQRRVYRQLLRVKGEAVWLSLVAAERSLRRQLWRSVDELTG